jgi:Fic-DOC domain mobile mystery protein B
MDPLVPVGDGHTELSDDESAELIPTYISTRRELFAAEERNIADGTLELRPPTATVLDDLYLRDLHRRMFSDVWKWAGRYRARETNLGVAPEAIATAVRSLVEDARAWVADDAFERDALAVRFHHQLVSIHPFVNGNGRHARIAADLLVRSLGGPAFTWGRSLDLPTDELRKRYHRALRRADDDRDDVEELRRFARS